MFRQRCKRRIEALLDQADVRLDGGRPWDVHILNDKLFKRIAVDGMLGVGEGYVDGWWECDQLDEMIARAFRVGFTRQVRTIKYFLGELNARFRNLQTRARAYQVGRQHYDLGQDVYRAMLDRRMIYSCAYWRRASTLEEAQEHKLELVARKLELEPGMRVLDIGCGWGGTLRYLAERYGISGVGITVSKDQCITGTELCKDLPIEIRLQDYRDLDEHFDRVFSLGMFEHVGYKNYRTYMQVVRRSLQPGGLLLLQTIGSKFSATHTDPWITRYIFPNGMLPSPAQITAAAEGLLNIEDWHNFPDDYARTLLCWYENFERAWDMLCERYDEEFFRMWRYYLLSCAGVFRAGGNQLWQIVFSRDGVPGGYRAENIR